MAYRTNSVPIPEGKITYNKSYVLLTLEDKYDPAKKYNVRKKVMIGKKCEDGSMFPNDNYFKYFPSEDSLAEPEEDRCDAQRVGAVSFVNKLIDKLSLYDKLSLVFGDDAARQIVDLAMYMCLSGSSTMQHFTSWGYDHPLYSGSAVSDSTISRFLQDSITDEQIMDFFKEWNQELDTGDTLYINCDPTNMNSDAKGIELVEYGYAKDDPSKPQINIALAAIHETNLPVFYDLYAGSYNDVSEFSFMLRMAKDLGYKNIGFILDRGHFSRENLREINSLGYQTIMMIKDNNLCAEAIIKEYGESLKKDVTKWIPEHKVYGVTIISNLYNGDSTEYHCHLYYSEEAGAYQRISLADILKKYERELARGVKEKSLRDSEAKKYAKYFDLEIDPESKLVTGFRMNINRVNEKLDQCGFFLIASSEKEDAEEVLTIYRERDGVEKLFASIKTGMDCDRFRVHSDERLRSKVFIVFVATILRSQFYNLMKTIKGKDKKHYTVPAAIKELEKVVAIRDNDDSFIRKRKLTSLQKKILKAVGVTEKELDEFIKEI